MFNNNSGEVEGRRSDDILPLAELSEAISQVFASGEPQLNLMLRCNVAGADKILVGQITPLRRARDEEEEVLLIFRDVTADRTMRHQLYQMGAAVSNIAHELNNPLTSVLGYLQLLLAADIPGEVKKDLEVISNNAQRAARTATNLLSLARSQKLEKTRTKVNDLVRQVLDTNGRQLKMSNITVVDELAPDLPELMVDPWQLEQVFCNIIANAERAMVESHGKGTLTVKAGIAGDMAKISFSDDGPGIPPQNLERLFVPFFTTAKPGKGTGLGLSISHSIVVEHGGRMYAHSEPGKGATFFVELPVATGVETASR